MFRCDSCPKAFCWEHLPKDGDWHRFHTGVPEDLAEVGYVARPSVLYVRCDSCRDKAVEKPVVYPGRQLHHACNGTLRYPPAYWEDRTDRHIEAVSQGLPPPNFRKSVDKKKLQEEAAREKERADEEARVKKAAMMAKKKATMAKKKSETLEVEKVAALQELSSTQIPEQPFAGKLAKLAKK